MPEIRDTDWAYATGFVDGEGCIAIVRSFDAKRDRYQYGVNVVVANRDREVLDWIKTFWLGSVVGVSGGRGLARPSWTWRCSTGPAKPFLEGIRPWLRIKRMQCDNALVMIALLQQLPHPWTYPIPAAWLEEQEKHYWIQRELNHRGTDAFVAKPMHSPRKIHRLRLSDA